MDLKIDLKKMNIDQYKTLVEICFNSYQISQQELLLSVANFTL